MTHLIVGAETTDDPLPVGAVYARRRTGENYAHFPYLAATTDPRITAELPATTLADPATNRRSELWVSTQPGSTLNFWPGDTLRFTGRCRAVLGAAAGTPEWHILWQLHGPLASGAYGAAAMRLVAKSGRLYLQNQAVQMLDLGPWPEATLFDVNLTIFMNSANGWAEGKIAGRTIQRWYPPYGTCHETQSYASVRCGLYRGGDGRPHPAYKQTSTWRDMTIARMPA